MWNYGQPVELADHLSFLAEAAEAGTTVPAGRLYGLPELPDDGCWLDMAGAAALTRVPPKTIASWLTRGPDLGQVWHLAGRVTRLTRG